jgi:hypothetical protein
METAVFWDVTQSSLVDAIDIEVGSFSLTFFNYLLDYRLSHHSRLNL